MEGTRLGIIGCGNMGSAIVRGLTAKRLISSDSILLYDKDMDKSNALAERCDCRQTDLPDVAGGTDILVVAVKPQDSRELLSKLAEYVSSEKLLVSVMAGVTINSISEMLGKNIPVIRAMPNMAAFVFESVTCLSGNDLVSDFEPAEKIFRGIGLVFRVEEKHMDAVTALSGSGPVYLFYLARAMVASGCQAGLSKELSEALVEQTLAGASVLLKRSEDTSDQLIEKVASKGGTTEAALSVFSEHDMHGIIQKAIVKAFDRSCELSKG